MELPLRGPKGLWGDPAPVPPSIPLDSPPFGPLLLRYIRPPQVPPSRAGPAGPDPGYAQGKLVKGWASSKPGGFTTALA